MNGPIWRTHVLIVRTCKHLASVRPRVEKVRPHESCWWMLSGCVSPTEKNTIKQLYWDYLPCAGFWKRYVGRIIACLKNAIGGLCPISDPNLYNQKGYFEQKKWKHQRNKIITSWKKHLSFANLDFRLASRGRQSPFVVLSSWVRCFVIIRVTMPYIGSTLSVIRTVMITR